jgi:hypothetical protein
MDRERFPAFLLTRQPSRGQLRSAAIEFDAHTSSENRIWTRRSVLSWVARYWTVLPARSSGSPSGNGFPGMATTTIRAGRPS